LFLSGGIASPSDPYWMAQYSDEEIAAAVYEARTRRTYVMAHAHTADAVLRCIASGVRSVEHATILDREAAEALGTEHDVFAVPTLVTLHRLALDGARLGLSTASLGKTIEVGKHALASLALLHEAGANIGFGTDLIGSLMAYQSEEFVLRREVMSAADVLRSATSINAELINMAGELGVIRAGSLADLLVIDGDPLADIGVMARPDRILMIMKDGVIHKNDLQ
jgi:imidazolonepropionase-like amidohydrolase